ncbi:MAG TPA: EthD domain-containing protein [Steroidobacteraceae bacterium]|nr:EthD domain-containing protein [Steroidobacteraceae bacterium]
MIKNIAFLKCKAGLSREAFIEYYETKHAPLILAIAPQISQYRRSYIIPSGAIVMPGAAPLDFDVVTELWYPDRQAHRAAMAAFTLPANAERIARDEENLFDRSRTRFFEVEERRSPIQ